jgi:hypothetical protein
LINPPGAAPDVGVPAELAAYLTAAEQNEWLREFLRSRIVSRRAALRGAAGALAGLGAAALLDGCGPQAVGASRLATPGPSALPSAPPAPPPAPMPPAFTGRRVSFGNDARTQMALAAELIDRPTGPVLIDLGTDLDYGHTLTAEIRHLVSLVPQEDGSIQAAEQYFAHGLARILRPGQSYHYRFRLPDGNTSPDAVFSTAPGGREAFTFTAFGDQGVDGEPGPSWSSTNEYYEGADSRRTQRPAAAMVAQIAARSPAFHLHAGDICYATTGKGFPVRNNADGPPDAPFDNFDPLTWTRYFASIEPSAASAPWMFATGNHDVEALYDDNVLDGTTHGYGGHAARLDLPTNGPQGCPSVYAFRYSNVGIVSIDSNDLTVETLGNAGYSHGTQLGWIRTTLATLRADPEIEFIVVVFHHCAYATSAGRASDDGVRSVLGPLFDEFSVDLAVQGHNHAWERTNPIRAGRTTTIAPDSSTVHPATDGTTYVCVGSGGRPRGPWEPGETDNYPGWSGVSSAGATIASILQLAGGNVTETVDWSQARYDDYAFIEVDVVPGAVGSESTMTVRTITDQGLLIDKVILARTAQAPAQPQTLDAWRTTGSGLTVPTRSV